MPRYDVVVAYQTRRGGVSVGMTIEADEADDEDDAHEAGRRKILTGYPARKYAWSTAELAEST